MTILTDNTFHPQNASALVRHCEAFGVQDLHTVETMCRFDPSVNIVRGTDKWIDIIRHDSTEEAIASLKASGYRIVAHNAPPRELHARDLRRGEGPFLSCLRDGACGRVTADHLGGGRVPAHTHVRYGREPQCLGLGRNIDIHASQRMRLSDVAWRLSETERSEVMFRWVMSSVRRRAAYTRSPFRRGGRECKIIPEMIIRRIK